MSNSRVTYHDLIACANEVCVQIISLDSCKRGSMLGSSTSMNVFSGSCKMNGLDQNVAFKFVKGILNTKTNEAKRSNILRHVKQEIRIMSLLKGHSHIVQLLAISFEDHTPILVLELAKSNLEEYLSSESVTWKKKLGFMYDIGLGLEAIHKVEVIHGDLKGANILIYDVGDDQMIAKVSDFGFSSTNFSVQEGRLPGFSHPFRSRECFDPELSDWNGKHTIDIYSYGLVVYQIAQNGTEPFEGYNDLQIDDMKRKGTEITVLMKLLPNDTPMEVKKVITATVRNVPSKRLGLDKLKNILEDAAEWNNVYSYEEANIAFEPLTHEAHQESIGIPEMNELSIPSSLKKTIFHEYQRLSENGDVPSLFMLGLCWLYSFGTKKNLFKVAECFTKAAEAGNASALNNLGVCYEDGIGVTKNYVKAFELYTKAVEAGSVSALNNLGNCYKKGNGVTKDCAKAIEIYTKASENGSAKAQNNLGTCYRNGDGVIRDYVKAAKLYTMAAEAGNASAQCNLGSCHEKGYGVTKDYVKAVELYTKAAETGNPKALNRLGVCYEDGIGVTKDYIKAVELYTKAAKAGDASAQNNLAVCYKKGNGVTKNYIKAAELYTKAAEAGNAFAQYNLGTCYKQGIGVTEDYVKAVKLYTKAAEAGNPKAQNNLGFCYEKGYGVAKDYIKAAELYAKAAEAGISKAQCNLGICYEKGVGVMKDYVKAVELYTRAAGAGDLKAQRYLDRLCKTGSSFRN